MYETMLIYAKSATYSHLAYIKLFSLPQGIAQMLSSPETCGVGEKV